VGIRNWILPESRPELIERLSTETGLPPLPCAVLSARGLGSAQEISAMLASGRTLGDPYLLKDMDKAVRRVQTALEQGEKIAVYGDYDCDGITATALMTSYLQSVGADAIYYIPDREKEGYGLNNGAVDFLHRQGITLVITVDNGVSAHGEITYASSLGIDTVVTDHHTPRETLPEAVAVVNPHRADCGSPFKHLAGVGVAFKLLCALEEDLDGSDLMEYYSDLVMLGTVADVVSLTGENRVLVRHGLERFAETERPGLRALLAVSGLDGSRLSSDSMAFGIIPRLNAAGRMGCVDDAVELLLTDDVPYAQELAASISQQNEERKKTENAIMAEIEGMLAENPGILNEKLLLIPGEGWHHGVVGIVAAKVLEKYGKPTILFSVGDGVARGSGRSVEGFSLIEAVAACAQHLTQYGGHKLAAGLTLPAERLARFRDDLLAFVREHYPVMPVRALRVDCMLDPKYLTPEYLEPLSLLEPFGQDNRPPLFLLGGMKVEGVYPTNDKKHLRIRLGSGADSLYAVYFRMREARFPYSAGDVVDVVADVSVGEWNGKRQVSVKVKDLRLSGVAQEQILQEREHYARYRAGEPCGPREQLIPCRDDFAVIYKYLRARGGYPHGAVELYYRLPKGVVGYGKLCVALDVLEEMGLITRDGRGETAAVSLLPAAGKVELERSKILSGLKV